VALARYRFLTTGQIAELWWEGRGLRAVRRRMMRLFEAEGVGVAGRAGGRVRCGAGAVPGARGERISCGCRRSLAGSRPLVASALLRSAPAATVRRLMAPRPARRTRVTLRCVREDLGLDPPPVEVDLGSLDHPLVAEARRLASAAPRGQKRILSIEHPLVYRSVTHAGAARRGWRPMRAASGFAPEPSARKARATTHTSTSPRCTKPDSSCRTRTTIFATRSNATPASSTRRPRRFQKRSLMRSRVAAET
jgi:hypothetical protein